MVVALHVLVGSQVAPGGKDTAPWPGMKLLLTSDSSLRKPDERAIILRVVDRSPFPHGFLVGMTRSATILGATSFPPALTLMRPVAVRGTSLVPKASVGVAVVLCTLVGS